jgi:putative FmdB family regulatory protein
MPIYEYECTSCGKVFDHMQKISDPAPACPDCGAVVQKRVTAGGFRLKGGGWYETDFKSGGKKNVAESASAAPACGTGACPACK